MDSKVCFTLVAGALCLSACSDFKVEEVPGHYSLVVIEDEPAGEKCPSGGKKIVSGVDMDRSGILELSEITDIKYVCTGIPGDDALVEVNEVAAGAEGCPLGGQKVVVGVDVDGDGVLAATEIKDSWVVCSGAIPSVSGRVTKMVTAYNQTCALIEDGTVQCWGVSGDGSDSSPVPVKVSGLYGVKDLAIGCALGDDGIVRCWKGLAGSPRAVADLKDVVAVAGSNHRHMCALKSDGSAVCWGDNSAGQLGNGSFASSASPVAVVGADGVALKGVKKLFTGSHHTCALMDDTSLKCWGWNEYGQLGLGSSGENFHSRAMNVVEDGGASLSQVSDVAMGYSHTCAALADGVVKCWGSNEVGQLGPSVSEASSKLPVDVDVAGEGEKVVSIGGGYGHTCAILSSGKVKCWGWNVYGQLGNEAVERSSATPVDVEGLTGASQVVLGEAHSCAMMGSAGIKCWGNNMLGQFGNGVEAVNQGYDHRPKKVVELSDVNSVSAGYLFSCATLDDSSTKGSQMVKCWGNDDYGQLGNNSYGTMQRFPVTVLAKDDGTALEGVSSKEGSLAAGYVHACALMEDGSVRCWGDNSQMQMGSTGQVAATIPVTVSGVRGAEMIAVGHAHSCASVIDSGVKKVKCWGYNDNGQLGNGGTGNAAAASVHDLEGKEIVDMALGRNHTCVLENDGTVWCWGGNAYRQLGLNLVGEGVESSNTPIKVTGIGPMVQIAAGHAHTCVVDGAGKVFCWGSNVFGESGAVIAADKPSVSASRIELAGSDAVAKKVVSGYQHTCVLTTDGKVQCWGSNGYGQLGNSVMTSSGTPVEIAGLSGVTDLTCGHQHTCAVLESKEVKCWGGDHYGQLGRVNGNPVPTDAAFVK